MRNNFLFTHVLYTYWIFNPMDYQTYQSVGLSVWFFTVEFLWGIWLKKSVSFAIFINPLYWIKYRQVKTLTQFLINIFFFGKTLIIFTTDDLLSYLVMNWFSFGLCRLILSLKGASLQIFHVNLCAQLLHSLHFRGNTLFL